LRRPRPGDQRPAAKTRRPLPSSIVDGDLLAEVMRDTLEVDGHDVTTANGGTAGHRGVRFESHAADNPIRWFITDLGMPQWMVAKWPRR